MSQPVNASTADDASSNNGPVLELAIRKQLKAFGLEAELSLDGSAGQVLVLFGPSGSGKTMTLKCLAGVTDPDAGFISIGGRTVFDSRQKLNVKLSQRRVGYLPQNYALFPHMSVAENIAFGLFDWEKKQARQRVNELLTLMRLEGLEKRRPRQLSGGQQQRVALARALAPRPSILLLDEPFSALDASIRAELRQNLALLSRNLHLPIVFITHDLEEAYMLADRVAVYDRGRVLQYNTREEIFYRPATQQVARLIGIRNLWEGRVLEVQPTSRRVLVHTTLCDIWAELPAATRLPASDSRVTVCLRPERLRLLRANVAGLNDQPTVLNSYPAQVTNEVARGSLYTLFLRLGQRENESNSTLAALVTEPATRPDLELEVTAREWAELKQDSAEDTSYLSKGWQVTISPAAVHLIF